MAGEVAMEAQEKEAQVAAWLKKIFGDHPIPQYEVNPRTTEILHHLSERNRVRDRDVHLVIEDLKQKASEYESEAKHLQDLLMESVNFSPANLSSTGSNYLNALVDSAVALETKDTSLASFIPAVNNLTSDLFRTKSKNEEIKLELAKLEKNLTATLVLEKCLREDLKKAELHLSTERAKVDNRLQNMDFLKAKSEEFRCGIRAAEIGELQRRQIICPRLSSCRYSQYNFKRRQPDPEAQALKHCTLLSQTRDYGNDSCAMSKCLDACVAFHL
ncbi:HAUS augmin-like complex subunit 1 isoform X2 [Rousettus aegyptiacus]|uniref:HAUS augmin-like complex subunit 1 isoform X2 n=1 Tax=Rousettus aegyptiacus TaxID=9407 RepID=UPI00168D92D9|nr:HAUS augmin-like complex subunit 1 isoform X2 [Rousettus aegyptiacus]